MKAIYDSASNALTALDSTADNAALAEMAAEGDRVSTAMRKAEARIAEITGQISALLQDRMADRNAAVAVAEALLGEADASEATASLVNERDLRNELNALRAGLRELQDRSRENSAGMAKLKAAALSKVVPALQPVVDTLIADARAAADTIAQTYASIAAISGTTRYFHYETRQFGDALARLMSSDLIARRDVIDTPEAVAEMLAPLTSKGPAVHCNVPTFAGVPDDRSAIGLMAGMAARQAVG
jgi:hypothetical protein